MIHYKFIFFAIVFFSALNIFGQAPRVRTFDAQHYIMRSSFDRQNKIYYGDTTVQVKPLKDGFKTLILDSVGMKFSSITLEPDGKPLTNFQQKGEQIVINLDKTYSPGDLISVRFKYSCNPTKGVYFVDEENVNEKFGNPSQVWTQGEAEEAHHWFPSYDFPDDKATTEQFITIPKDEIAISNGEQLETTENADGTKTVHFKMPVVHSIYLTSFIVGKYVKVESKYKNIPLGYYVYPGREAIAERAYGKTADMMRVFEEVTGVDYPYNKYDQTYVARFQFGGMENITATTMDDNSISGAETDFGRDMVIDLVSHELAHSWFGNLVTTKDWSNLWLNEGFATFMEAVYREHVNGRADYMRKVREDADGFMGRDSFGQVRPPLFNPKADPNTVFDEPAFVYQKGGAVIHTLREEIGNEVFWKAVNLYLNRHKFSNTVSNDLKTAMEEASGKDLTWFFNQWVFKGGFPRLTVKQTYLAAKKRLTLTVTQTQKIDSINSSAFVLPLEIEIRTAKGTKTERIRLDKRIQTFTLQTDGRPTKITIDKSDKIPIKTVKILPLAK